MPNSDAREQTEEIMAQIAVNIDNANALKLTTQQYNAVYEAVYYTLEGLQPL